MTDVHAIILVPSVEHRAALLREGPCGAVPPMVWAGRTHDVWYGDRCALVLAWDGVPVPEGCFRLLWVLTSELDLLGAEAGMWPHPHDAGWCLRAVRYLAEVARTARVGSAVYLDAAGREVEP